MRPPSPDSTGRAGRGRATRQFWASPVVTVNDADDSVAGCSPQFCVAQLRSQNLAGTQSLASRQDTLHVDSYHRMKT